MRKERRKNCKSRSRSRTWMRNAKTKCAYRNERKQTSGNKKARKNVKDMKGREEDVGLSQEN